MSDLRNVNSDNLMKLFTPIETIANQMLKARENDKPYSLVRIGDGENAVLSQCISEEYQELSWVQTNNVSRSGISLPDLTAMNEMFSAIRHADTVGILFQTESKWHWKMTKKVLVARNICPRQICYAFANLSLVTKKEFRELLNYSNIVITGRLANDLADFFNSRNINVTDTLAVNSYSDVSPVINKLNKINFDVCLASCGVGAVTIAQQVAEKYGKIGIDFGHAADGLLGKLPGRILYLYGEK